MTRVIRSRPLYRFVRLISLAGILVACQGAPGAPLPQLGAHLNTWVPDSAATVLHIGYGGLGAPSRLVIRDAGTFADVWRRIHRGLFPQPPIPAVNFALEQVVLVDIGGRPTGGYWVTIDSIGAYASGSSVFFTNASPGRSCFVTEAFTEPAHMVRAPLVLLDSVVFVERAVTREC